MTPGLATILAQIIATLRAAGYGARFPTTQH